MSNRTVTIDCRGLPTAIAVLRIKQALQNLSARHEPIIARVSRASLHNEIAAALRARACSVRLVSGDARVPAAATALAS